MSIQTPLPDSAVAGIFVSMEHDALIVGASFAGLACAAALAERGVGVSVLDRRPEAGLRLHTTGILVRDALDTVPLLEGLSAKLVRRIDRVRLYAPNLRYVDLAAPDYYFLATDTPGLMRWLAQRAASAGARLHWGSAFRTAQPIRSGFDLGEPFGTTRVLIGADGPRSAVARSLGLGRNRQFLAGIEYEYEGTKLADDGYLHCFIDAKLMPGYIGWVLQGVGVTQVGLARDHHTRDGLGVVSAMELFLDKIAPVFDFRGHSPVATRAGLIPSGGPVHPVARSRALLIGDAAGMVSPVTAGGIHRALQHGAGAGHVVADFLAGRGEDPAVWAARTYPRFRVERTLRFAFDHLQADWMFNLLLATRPMRRIASQLYFHRRGIAPLSGAG
jgi:digeranylgeranylglycerophospholipid reductase